MTVRKTCKFWWKKKKRIRLPFWHTRNALVSPIVFGCAKPNSRFFNGSSAVLTRRTVIRLRLKRATQVSRNQTYRDNISSGFTWFSKHRKTLLITLAAHYAVTAYRMRPSIFFYVPKYHSFPLWFTVNLKQRASSEFVVFSCRKLLRKKK